MRLGMPDVACKSIDVEGVRYAGGPDGTVEVDNPRHARQLIREGQAFVASGRTAAAPGGYICPACSFRSFFTTCGRCGGTCSKGTR